MYLSCIQHLEIPLVLDYVQEIMFAQAQNFEFEIRTFLCLAAMTSVSSVTGHMAIVYCNLFGNSFELQGRCVL